MVKHTPLPTTSNDDGEGRNETKKGREIERERKKMSQNTVSVF